MKRRDFVKQITMAGTSMTLLPGMTSESLAAVNQNSNSLKKDAMIRIGLIGNGGMGKEDTNAALACDNIQLTAVCDLYDVKLRQATENWGNDLFLTKDYHELLSRKDVDAVIIATPDHWHKPIIMDALKAGKHVYCEKPVIHDLSEAEDLILAQKQTNRIVQVGSQGMASLGNQKARQLLQSGVIGNLVHVEGNFTKYLGFRTIPEEATEKAIWWDRFLGNTPKIPFDAMRFLFWRGYDEYGTGVAGDLFVHVISSLHYITDSFGPEKIYATGDIMHYKDGSRNSPDLMLGTFNYPQRQGIGPFFATLTANLSDGVSKKWASMNFSLEGDKGILEVGWNWVKLKTNEELDINIFKELKPLGHGFDTPRQVNSIKKEKNDGLFMGFTSLEKEATNDFIFEADKDYVGGHISHFQNFFNGIRNNAPVESDILFGLRAAAPAILSNLSNKTGMPVAWNPELLKII